MSEYTVLVINPGSTSTKFALFRGDHDLITKSIDHPAEEIEGFERVIDQYNYRRDVIMNALKSEGFELDTLDAVVGRGGVLHPFPSGGTYAVNELMKEHLIQGVGGEHASNLGGLIASAIGEAIGKPSFIVDPVVVDELMPIARYTGIPEIRRRSIWHALNHKAVAREYAISLGRRYEDLRLIVAHLGGGISVAAHDRGRAVDVNNALDGDGPFTPTRAGTIPAMQLVDMALSGKYDRNHFKGILSKKGGMVSYLGTNDARDVNEMIDRGEEKAIEVFKAMAYSVAKAITGLVPAFDGCKPDQIILTGGLGRDDILVGHITKMVAPLGIGITVIPGERELKGLRDGALRVLNGDEKAKVYKGLDA